MDEATKTPEWQRVTGHSMDGYTLYQAKGIYQTQEEVDNSVHLDGAKPGDLIYEDTNDDGKITFDDAVRTDKSATPRWMFGLTLGGSWKGIDLTAFFQGQADAQILVKPTMNMAKDFMTVVIVRMLQLRKMLMQSGHVLLCQYRKLTITMLWILIGGYVMLLCTSEIIGDRLYLP